MQTHIVDFDYSIHTIARVTHQLKIVEEPIIGSNKSKLDVFIVRINSGKEADGGNEALKLTVNDEVVLNNTYVTPTIPASSTQEVFIKSVYISHNSDGAGPLNISAVYKCDYIEGWGLDIFWWTVAKAEISANLTPIDRSKPTISNIVKMQNRYGTGVSISFNASHKSYSLTSIQLTLSKLTYEQATHRVGKITQADTSECVQIYENNYGLVLTKTENLSESNDIFFDLDDIENGKYPLVSGQGYDFEIEVRALNGISNKYTGWLYIPQKVTGITCESEINLLPEQSTELVYEVVPQNAEEKGVIFHSSDTTVATVDDNGKITAVGEGMCQITVTTLDGGSLDAVSGFSASCQLTVLDKNHFPKLDVVRYLSVRDVTNILFACEFLRNKLIEKGLYVPELESVIYKGRTHPVKDIKNLLQTINTNCFILKDYSNGDYPTESLVNYASISKQNTEKSWYVYINEWIRFLNELNNMIEKEV